jgi:hypothetical protein
MPRKRAVTVGKTPNGGGVRIDVTPEPSPEPQPTPDTDEQRSADEDFEQADIEGSRAPFILLYRVNRRTGQRSRLGKFDPQIVDGDWVTEQFGGGKYFGKKMVPSASGGFEYAGGKNGKKGTVNFDIDEMVYPPKGAPPPAPATGPISAPPGRVGGADLIEAGILQLFQASQGMQQMQTQMMMAFIEKMSHTPERKETDLMPLLVALLEKRRDPMEIARELYETTAKATARAPEPPSAMLEAMSLYDRIEARVRRSSPSASTAAEPTDDSIFGFLKSTAPDLLRLYEKQLDVRADLVRRGLMPATGAPPGTPPAAPTGQPTLAPPAPAPTMYVPPEAVAAQAGVTPSSPPVVSGPVTDPSMPFWAPFLKPFVGEFLDYAKKGKDPKACADLLLTRLELNDQLEMAAPLIDDSTFGEQFVRAFPGFAPYAVWVEMMLQAGREDLSQSDDDSEPDDT